MSRGVSRVYATLELKDRCWVPFNVYILQSGGCELLSMLALKKICPQCFANVNVRGSLCDCGHFFMLKITPRVQHLSAFIITSSA